MVPPKLATLWFVLLIALHFGEWRNGLIVSNPSNFGHMPVMRKCHDITIEAN